MLNPSQLEAVAMADALTQNTGLIGYSELLKIAQEAAGVAAWYVPDHEKTDKRTIDNCLSALVVFANENGREQ